MGTPFGKTQDGFEMQFGSNHIGHFELFRGLVPALKEGHQKTGKTSRVVNVSSLAHVFSNVVFDDVNYKNREYNKWLSYGQSKTANILFGVGITKRFKADGILSNSLHPGFDS